MSKKETFIHVTSRIEEDGVTVYSHEGVDVALKLPPKGGARGSVVDLREHPLFLAMSPCPYCDALNDRGHDPLAHRDHFLGTPINEEIRFSVFDNEATRLDVEFQSRILP